LETKRLNYLSQPLPFQEPQQGIEQALVMSKTDDANNPS